MAELHELSPHREQLRLAAVQELDMLDTPPEERFDRIARLVHNVFDVPIALVSLMDEHRQWHKARIGIDAPQAERKDTLCRYPIASGEPLIVPDLLRDERLRDNPFVAGDPYIRFYAGIPLKAEGDHAIGTLCAIDMKPRTFSCRDVAIMSDLARIAEQEFELRRMADTDVLTTAMSRRAFRAEGEDVLRIGRASGRPASAIMIDIDHFKTINDTHGHAGGDAVLAGVAALCRAHLRESDLFGRLGGEEFAVLLPQTDGGGALAVAEKLRDLVRTTRLRVGETELQATASFGVATSTPATRSLDELLDDADRALYRAKTQGRDRVACAGA